MVKVSYESKDSLPRLFWDMAVVAALKADKEKIVASFTNYTRAQAGTTWV